MTNFTDRFVEVEIKKLGATYEYGFHILAGPNNMCLCGRYEGKPKRCSDFLRSSLLEFAKEIRREVADLAKQNTYEGEAKLVYSTTMREVLALLPEETNNT